MGSCIGPARIGKQRPVAEGARPELHAALKPPDDIAVGDHVGGFAGGILASPRHQTGLLDGGQDLSLVELRTEIRGCAARRRLRICVRRNELPELHRSRCPHHAARTE